MYLHAIMFHFKGCLELKINIISGLTNSISTTFILSYVRTTTRCTWLYTYTILEVTYCNTRVYRMIRHENMILVIMKSFQHTRRQ